MVCFQAEAELQMIQLSTRIIEEINEKSTCQSPAGQVKTFSDFIIGRTNIFVIFVTSLPSVLTWAPDLEPRPQSVYQKAAWTKTLHYIDIDVTTSSL